VGAKKLNNQESTTEAVVILAEYQHGICTVRCQTLAEKTQLQVVDVCTAPDQLLLTWIDDALTLCVGSHLRGGSSHPLARAANIRGSSKPFICDATGGLGRDAFVLASLGCEVVVLEHSPIVFALLADGLRRARQHADISPIANRMTVHNLDSKSLPEVWPNNRLPDTVYLDPMYPHNHKLTAKKEMQLLQRLSLDESRESALLSGAIATAINRVTVKRPLNAAKLEGPLPVGAIKSTNTRYDIYPGAGTQTQIKCSETFKPFK